jgi:hypothetical protein
MAHQRTVARRSETYHRFEMTGVASEITLCGGFNRANGFSINSSLNGRNKYRATSLRTDTDAQTLAKQGQKVARNKIKRARNRAPFSATLKRY